MKYSIKRYLFFVFSAISALAFPFIKINGNQLFLISFDKQQIHLFGVVFQAQELYVMPFIIMLLFIGLFFVTVVWGRIWCGWACPQTIFRVIFRDLIQTKILKLRKRVSNKTVEPNMSLLKNKLKFYASIVIYSVFALIAAANFMWVFITPHDFLANLLDPANHTFFIIFFMSTFAWLMVDIILIKENFCIYVCPYARVQSILYDEHTYTAAYDTKRGGIVYDAENVRSIHKKREFKNNEECVVCEKCVTVCPTGIDIRKGLQIECIECLECVDACDEVMSKFNKPSLIQWQSEHEASHKGITKILRSKVVAYALLLFGILSGIVVMSLKKENMLLNINRTSQLYSVVENNNINNGYIFLFQNTSNKKHSYYFEINDKNIKIIRPKNPIELRAGAIIKKVVVLQASKKYISSMAKKNSTHFFIKVKSFAVDDKENISVERDSVFAHPVFVK